MKQLKKRKGLQGAYLELPHRLPHRARISRRQRHLQGRCHIPCDAHRGQVRRQARAQQAPPWTAEMYMPYSGMYGLCTCNTPSAQCSKPYFACEPCHALLYTQATRIQW